MQTKQKAIIENDLILRAANCETIDRAPVWMMRQAGRYLPEYMAIRKEMSFLELCKNPVKAAEVSIQPLDIVGVDAIIMFSDILIPLEPMGAPVSFDTGSPKFLEPIRTHEQVEKMIIPDLAQTCHFVYETIHEIKKQITREENGTSIQRVPVLGFAGAPWTLASYLIEGGGSKNFENIKGMMYREPKTMHLLLEKLSETIAQYLILKLENGADMLQLFDTWASVLSQSDYQEFALPYQQKIISKIKAKYPDTKITLYVNGVTNILDYMLDSGANILSVDWACNLKEIKDYVASVDGNIAIQGNFDPCHLLGPRDFVEQKTKEMLSSIDFNKGYIANLGHGILPMVPVENAKTFVETVKNFK